MSILGNDLYVEGRCFLCGKTEGMELQFYCHYECAIAYTDDKDKKLKEKEFGVIWD